MCCATVGNMAGFVWLLWRIGALEDVPGCQRMRSGADWPPLRLSLALTKPISPHAWHRGVQYVSSRRSKDWRSGGQNLSDSSSPVFLYQLQTESSRVTINNQISQIWLLINIYMHFNKNNSWIVCYNGERK